MYPQRGIEAGVSIKQFRKIVYNANLTTCSAGKEREYYEYCEYQKDFLISKMEIVAREEIATFVWVLLALCSTGVAARMSGLDHVDRRQLSMRFVKKRRIKRMEDEFEEKRRNVALPSDRVSARVGQDVYIQNPHVGSEVPMRS